MIVTRRQLLGLAVGVAMATVAGLAGTGAEAAKSKPVNTLDSKSGAAIKGYDPVAYFIESKPVRGKPEHTLVHGGATWLFASAENKALFEKDPQKYTPAYGGYCAYGVSRGYLVKIEPDAWTIRDGRLYLNYDLGVKKDWDRNPASYIEKADRKWPGLVDAR